MWRRDEAPNPMPSQPQPEKQAPRPETLRSSPPVAGERATIGRSITIRGEVSGDEDLLIQGQVEGSVDLKDQSVTVGREGKVKANITGRMVTVEGEVEGNLKADEQVILKSSARVQGDIVAPRVALEDGATFRGGIDMGVSPTKEERTSPAAVTASRKPLESTASATTSSSGGAAPKKESDEVAGKAGG
jgi:cytoskeletal protein CcmA (bactofilin family)